MRFPHVRFTVRRLMVAVAVVAAIIGIEKGRRRSEELLGIASYYARKEDACLAGVQMADSAARSYRSQAEKFRTEFPDKPDELMAMSRDGLAEAMEKLSAKEREAAAEWGRLRMMFERAARYPWLRVQPNAPAVELNTPAPPPA